MHSRIGFLLLLSAFLGAALPQAFVGAQAKTFDIAQRYPVADQSLVFGDVVVYDRDALIYRLSSAHGESAAFGIAVESPVLLLDDGTSNVPIVRSGEAFVNVVAANGAIAAGDYITTSSVPGKGERTNADDTYMVGIALEPYGGAADEVVGEVSGVSYGRVRVLLSIGLVSKAQETLTGEPPIEERGFSEATVLNIIQYVLAAFIAVGSVFIAFRNFGPNIKNGVVSIGRNPLARASIQSMIILNSVLIVLVSGGGLLVSLAILLLPI